MTSSFKSILVAASFLIVSYVQAVPGTVSSSVTVPVDLPSGHQAVTLTETLQFNDGVPVLRLLGSIGPDFDGAQRSLAFNVVLWLQNKEGVSLNPSHIISWNITDQRKLIILHDDPSEGFMKSEFDLPYSLLGYLVQRSLFESQLQVQSRLFATSEQLMAGVFPDERLAGVLFPGASSSVGRVGQRCEDLLTSGAQPPLSPHHVELL